MYIWKVDELVEDFRSGAVTQKEEFKYLLLFTIAMAIACDPALYIDMSYNHFDTIGSATGILISIIGLFFCYKANSSGDNKDFIVRTMCIGLPVLIRTLAIFIPIFIVAGILEGAAMATSESESEPIESTLMQVVLMALMVSFYYYYLSTKLRNVSSVNA